MLGRHRAVRRADAAQPRARPAEERRQHHRHLAAEHRDRRGPQAVRGDAATSSNIPQPPNGLATNEAEALGSVASGSAIPVLVRPSASCSAGARCRSFIPTPNCSITCGSPSRPRRNGRCWWTNFSKTPPRWTWIASRTSGSSRIRTRARSSSAGCWSTSNLPASIPATPRWCCRRTRFRKTVIETIRDYTHAMARELKVIGLMNVQYAVKGDTVYVLEVNPRASRTVPFVSKAIGVPLAKLAAKVMAGKTLEGTRFHRGNLAEVLGGEGIRVSVQPFSRPGHFALAGNAFHRRSHGPGRRSRHRLREIADGGERAAAAERPGVHQRERRAQERSGGGGAGSLPIWALNWSPRAARRRCWRRRA